MVKMIRNITLAAFALVALAVLGRVGLLMAETWNSEAHTFNVPVTANDALTMTDAVVKTPTTLSAAATVSLEIPKYDLDSTAGAFVVSLPSSATSAPADGQCWEFSLQVANGAVSLSPSAVGDLLDGSQAAYAGIDALGDSATVCYDAGTTNYYFQSRYIH